MGKVMKAMKAKAATKAKAKAATIKRPAAAKSKSLKDQCEDWKLALTASQGSGDEEMEGTHRDKGKGVKFQKIKSQLPQHIPCHDHQQTLQAPGQWRFGLEHKGCILRRISYCL